MHVSLICVVLMAAASSVLSYDVNLWGLRQQSRTQAERKSEKILEIKALVNELAEMEEQRDLASCLAPINDAVNVAKLLVGNVVTAIPAAATAVSTVDVSSLVNLGVNILAVVTSNVKPLVDALVGTASCLVGAVGDLLKQVLACLNPLLGITSGRVLGDPAAAITCITTFVVGLLASVGAVVQSLVGTITNLLSVLNIVDTLLTGLNLSGLLGGITGLLNVTGALQAVPIGDILKSLNLTSVLSGVLGLLGSLLGGLGR